MKIAILMNDSEMAKYFASKLSGLIKIDEVIIEKRDIKQTAPQKHLIERLFGRQVFKILKSIKSILLSGNRLHALERKLEKRARETYLPDYEETVGTFALGTETLDFNAQDDLKRLRNKHIDLFILFGTSIVKKPLLEIPSMATINLHTSLLPYYKGTFVEFWQLMNQEFEHCGATVHLVDTGVDSGNILVQERIEVRDTDTFYDLRYKNILKGIELIPKAVSLVEDGARGYPQEKIAQETFRYKMLTEEKKIAFYKRLGLY